ncbi:MAG: family lipase [Polaromonas sp.]|nr:family lipase [Polaromonas sp.]
MKPVARSAFLHRLTLLALTGASALSAQAEINVSPDMRPGGKLALATAAAAPSPVYARWQSTLDAFAVTDQQAHPASDGVLFVGSSTIRLWSRLSQDFRQVPVLLNRGFGGSTMRDCNALVRELVIQYKPKQVLVYAGDNDLAEGRTPEAVLGSFASFVRSVQAELPGARISYISIKPSPLRVALLPKVRETNALIASYVKTVPQARYIDIFNPMLAADGLPRPELFLADQLHLNDAGYRLWQAVIAADLSLAPLTAEPPARPLQQATAGR